MASWNLQAVKPHLNGANNASKSKSNIAGKSLLNIGKESGTKHQSNVKGMQGGALSMSVEMPEVIEPQDIEYACACIHRPQDEIMWSVGKVLQDFHKRNQFNDALIKVSNGQVMAHRHVLSASSPWLHNFLHSSAKRTLQVGYQQLTEIRMDEKLDAAAVTQIVDYMYTARCRLNYFNVYAVYQAATYLRMATLIAACQRLLSVLMSDQNIAIMLEIVEEAVGNAQLITFIYQHWADQFYKQIELASFVHWPYQRMYRLLSNDDVTVDTEKDILTAALRWINHDRAHRMDHLTELMKIVRWVYFSQEELLQAVEFEKMLIQEKEVKQLITDAQWYKTCQEYKYNWTEYKIPPSRIIKQKSSNGPDSGQVEHCDLTSAKSLPQSTSNSAANESTHQSR